MSSPPNLNEIVEVEMPTPEEVVESNRDELLILRKVLLEEKSGIRSAELLMKYFESSAGAVESLSTILNSWPEDRIREVLFGFKVIYTWTRDPVAELADKYIDHNLLP